MMRVSLTYTVVVAGAALLGGCPSAVDDPTWVNDIQPIVEANCVRCHLPPQLMGAPPSFRLDIYDDTTTPDGIVIRGAGTMAEFMAARVSDGSMPPRFPLADHHRETLENWAAARDGTTRPPLGEPRADNREPTMTLLTPLESSRVLDSVLFVYEIRDPDFDIVYGIIRVQDGAGFTREISGLHAGRGEAEWDLSEVPEATYQVTALLDDSNGIHTVDLGNFDVVHDGNVSPRLTFQSPRTNSLLSDGDAPFPIEVTLGDLDPLDLHTVTLVAFLGEQEVVITTDHAVVAGALEPPLVWGTTAVPAGHSWRIRASVTTTTDGDATHDFVSAPFAITHGAATLTYADVEQIFVNKCAATCHNDRIPTIAYNFNAYTDNGVGVYDLRGLLYRRVSVLKNMPPKSAVVFDPQAALTDDERTLITEWFEQGAPP